MYKCSSQFRKISMSVPWSSCPAFFSHGNSPAWQQDGTDDGLYHDWKPIIARFHKWGTSIDGCFKKGKILFFNGWWDDDWSYASFMETPICN